MTDWTSPKTWAAETLTSTDLNTYVRDNFNHLYDRANSVEYYNLNAGADISTSSSTFTLVDAGFGLAITTTGGPLFVWFAGSITHPSNGADRTYFDIYLNSAYVGGDDGIVEVTVDTAGDAGNASFFYHIPAPTAGVQTVQLHWKTSGGDAKMWAGAGTTNHDLHPQFGVFEG